MTDPQKTAVLQSVGRADLRKHRPPVCEVIVDASRLREMLETHGLEIS